MKKSAIFTYSLLIVLFLSSFTVSAESTRSRYFDEVGLLTDAEAKYITELLDDVSETYENDTVIAVVDSLEGEAPTELAAEYFDSFGFGLGNDRRGIILLLSMEERDCAICTFGEGDVPITTDDIEIIMSVLISDYFANDCFYDGFVGFADQCATRYIRGVPSDDAIVSANRREYDDSAEDTDPSVLTCLLVSAVIGLVAAIITTSVLKGQLKSVKSAENAASYIKPNSFSLSGSRNIFLYSTVTKVAKPQNNSSNSRGGSSSFRGGRSGKF